LRNSELFLIVRRTRNDIPEAVANAELPEDLREVAERYGGRCKKEERREGRDGVSEARES